MTEPDYHGSLRSALEAFASVCRAFTGQAERTEQAGHSGPAVSGGAGASAVAADAVLKALLETILPFDPLRFPHHRLAHCQTLFAARLAPAHAWRKSLSAFNAAEAFPNLTDSTLAQERRALEAYPANTPELVRKQLERKRCQDEKLLDFFLTKHGPTVRPFTDMDLSARRDYFWLWSQSGFSLKRRFHRACKGAILAAACAAPELRAYPDQAGGRQART